jgi:hypothetical protein
VLTEPEFNSHIDGLIADTRVHGLIPTARSWEQLPETLTHLSPNLCRLEHVSLAPALSASAETVRNDESHCQA